MMNKQQRQRRGDRNFNTYVMPTLQKYYKQAWVSTSGTDLDCKHGIDWIYNDTIHVSSRCWLSRFYTNHTIRYRSLVDTRKRLEYDIIKDNYLDHALIQDLRIEAWIYEGKVTIAISKSKVLWHSILKQGPDRLRKFKVKDPRGYTEFLSNGFNQLLEPPRIIEAII